MKSFNERCYQLLIRIPKGKVTTYAEIARKLNSPKAFKAVGNAMALNKDLLKYPCYKVVKSNGDLNSYQLGLDKKRELLEKEGIKVVCNKVDLKKYFHKF